jgi:hypothetical protein
MRSARIRDDALGKVSGVIRADKPDRMRREGDVEERLVPFPLGDPRG